jgi:hypothetical protein
MASPLIPILVIVAVGAAVLLTKKKDREDKLETTQPEPRAEGPEGVEMRLPPPTPFPKDWGERFFSEYPATVDACVEDLGLLEVDELKKCALERIFPEAPWPPQAPWPPPQNAHQWQRNVWFNKDFGDYIRAKWPPVS